MLIPSIKDGKTYRVKMMKMMCLRKNIQTDTHTFGYTDCATAPDSVLRADRALPALVHTEIRLEWDSERQRRSHANKL